MRVMTSFLQVKQVQSYSGPWSQVPLLCKCAQRAMLYLRLGSMTGAQGGCSAVRSGHTVCVPAVCGQGAWGWLSTQGSKCQFKMPHFLLFCLCSSTSIVGAAMPCVCSLSLWRPAFLALSFFLQGAHKFNRKSGSCLLSAECPTSWSFSLFGTAGLDVGA